MSPVNHDADPAATTTLELSDGTRFPFNPLLLAHVSPFFADLLKAPPPTGTEADPIPVCVSADTLELCLDLISSGLNHRGKKPPFWPPTVVLDEIIQFVDAYDAPFVADQLLLVTANPENPRLLELSQDQLSKFFAQPFERYAFACATKSPYVHKELSNTLECHHTSMTSWAEKTLAKRDPLALAELYKARLGKSHGT